jgi:hypothetical protein
MNLRLFTAALASTLVLSHCAPESPLSPVTEVAPKELIPVGPETSFAHDPAGSQLVYESKGREYAYKLKKLGFYSFAVASKNRKAPQVRDGRWSYKQTGPKSGELQIDDRTWMLTFTSPHRATAKAKGMRTQTFEFEWL